ncbi:MAG: DUF1015 domain-containing protein [Ruminococcus sp.]|nr:DUF1015 domain-containing protein [Ruminococcus sp.]
MEYFSAADILIPKKDFEKWAVIACDQYTSERNYWQDVERITEGYPSALNIVLPEVYLKKDNSERINDINETMLEYLEGDVFEEHKNSMIYVERESNHTIRRGLVGVIDLEDYDYKKDSDALIRATEATVLDRIPPRIEIRKNASLEMPHVILLFDDPKLSVIEPLKDKKKNFKSAYNFELMKGGGHIDGWFLDEQTICEVQNALKRLLESKDDTMLFAVGDGNHSLASAKECYNLSKNPLERYALVEIVNIHDESISFQPIYRVLFNVDEKDFLDSFKIYTDHMGSQNTQFFEYVSTKKSGFLEVKSTAKLPIGTLQGFIDRYVSAHPNVKVDYIHGSEVVRKLCKTPNTLGFLFDGMTKAELFPAISADGSLPRKTFSMGHAQDKRFYLEARRIKS